MLGYVTFVKALLQSSALLRSTYGCWKAMLDSGVSWVFPRTERLEKYCDLSTAEMLGKGAYGFVTWSRWSVPSV